MILYVIIGSNKVLIFDKKIKPNLLKNKNKVINSHYKFLYKVR